MSVYLVPDKNLHFYGSFTQPVKRTLTITNENATPVYFKVKTTRVALNIYTVRPNQGRIEPGESIDVTIGLYPMRSRTPLYARRHDRFLVQSTFFKPEMTEDPHAIWNRPDDAKQEMEIHSRQLFAVYLPNTSPDDISDSVHAFTTKCKHLLSSLLPFKRSTASRPSSFATASFPAIKTPSMRSESLYHHESRNESRESVREVSHEDR